MLLLLLRYDCSLRLIFKLASAQQLQASGTEGPWLVVSHVRELGLCSHSQTGVSENRDPNIGL